MTTIKAGDASGAGCAAAARARVAARIMRRALAVLGGARCAAVFCVPSRPSGVAALRLLAPTPHSSRPAL
ncbi:hypothetical protein DIJ60_14290, partial [Burkholderia pseudomallei]